MNQTKKLVTAAICLALCMVLPFLTGNIPQIGSMLCPMHIPVLLCGFLCGPFYGAVVGAAAPLLRFALFGMPPILPNGVAMCFELAVYGLVSGWLYHILLRKKVNGNLSVYAALVTAMVTGRIAWGIVRVILSGAGGYAFTWQAFMAGAFLNAIPGIIVQIILIPVIVLALKKAVPQIEPECSL
ncbi:MAG: ECF transporter S component [Thermoflexaceae bacterium]|nr:ECF transporter S component [Thermoflexaceae bacterium]